MEAPKQSKSRSGIQVIARAATILRTLENERDGLSLGEIASRVDLARSTVQRIVAALADEQLLIAASPKSRVKLGPALIRLANATNTDITQLVKPFMETLSHSLGETIDLSVIQGDHAVFIDQVPGSHRLRAVSAVGDKFALHSTACGKALLSTLSPEKRDRILFGGLEVFTENTITDPEALRLQIKSSSKQGFFLDLEENTDGVCAVGAKFEDALGRSYAISIPTPVNRFGRNQDTYTEELKKVVGEIEEKILAAP